MNDMKEQYAKQFDTGDYLSNLRIGKNIRLTYVAHELGISKSYLSEIEKGIKLPSDSLIRLIADFYEIPEDELFSRWGKIPLLSREQFKEMPNIQKVLSDLRKHKFSEDDIDGLSNEIIELYKNFLHRIDEKKL